MSRLLKKVFAISCCLCRYSLVNGAGSSGDKIVLLEEIPGFSRRNPSDFISILRAYVSSRSGHPLVIVQSVGNASGKTTSSSSSSSESALSDDAVLSELGADVISFNAATTTNLVRALKDIAAVEARKNPGRCAVPGREELMALAEISGGDIRSAVNALQVACLKGDLKKSIFERYLCTFRFSH